MSFYSGITIQPAMCTFSENDMEEQETIVDDDENMDCDSGTENLDIMVGLKEEHSKLRSEVVQHCNSFVDDVGERIETLDVQ